ncbi:MAG TPA: transcriptional regulator [Saprospirales bacterium]|nr:transcriptional regulator [Saprospirales bacterium]
MPELSRFLGIIIFMNFNEHNPPHFHAKYGDYEIIVELNSGIVEGKFPKRALALVLEWYEIHKTELMENWVMMQTTGDFKKIKPLE